MANLSTAARNKLPKSKFAFPQERKGPLTDAKHVRNAISQCVTRAISRQRLMLALYDLRCAPAPPASR